MSQYKLLLECFMNVSLCDEIVITNINIQIEWNNSFMAHKLLYQSVGDFCVIILLFSLLCRFSFVYCWPVTNYVSAAQISESTHMPSFCFFFSSADFVCLSVSTHVIPRRNNSIAFESNGLIHCTFCDLHGRCKQHRQRRRINWFLTKYGDVIK